jgi:ferrous iron transport protein B
VPEKIALVGSPNTGKSVVFHHLTGAYATVSNYPGTTVEVSTGNGQIHDRHYVVVDTPGMYNRERIIATFLLALAIPCSAQIGVLLGILADNPMATLIWAMLLVGVFLVVGFLTAQLMPGERPSFYMEVPPLRTPKIGNILLKTYSRIEWYLKEVFPMFILASVLIWLGQLTGIFTLLVNLLSYPVTWIGLPSETAIAFLFGFFRRDYGAAGLYDLQRTGYLSGVPLVVAAATLTLFVPCIAQFSVTAKERGGKTALAIALFIFPFAFIVGYLLNATLLALGVVL